MITYSAMLKKKDGTVRNMNFARLSDVQDRLPPSKGGTAKKLQPNQEMVWDLEENNYRIFNWSSVIGDVVAKKDY